ncbi:MAG: FG-GAP-like repeat-containing protein [Acidobacteriota bacterium]|nr:FG-GAP-like repeat-containing protein [Acidobacteriota bacterium]
MLNQFINKFRNTSKLFICAALCGLSVFMAAAAPADLDRTFGTNGVSVKSIGDSSFFHDVAVQPDGKIIAVGTTSSNGNKLYLAARFNADGTSDATFGGGSGYISLNPGGTNSYVKTVIVLPNGKILLVAHNDATKDIEVLRRLPNGDADVTFNGTGSLTFAIGSGDDVPADALVQPDGKILIAGNCVDNSNGAPQPRLCFARLNSNGTFDNAFGSQNGAPGRNLVQVTAGMNSPVVKSIALLPDGRIVVAGDFAYPIFRQYFLMRLSANGVVDTNFGSQGFVFPPTVNFNIAEKIIVTAHGRLLVGGTSTSDVIVNGQSASNFFVAMFNFDGSADPAFGGVRYIDFENRTDILRDLAYQPNGTIIAVGYSQTTVDAPADFATVRLLLNGSLDPHYGNAGKHIYSMNGSEELSAVSVQPNGRIVGAGKASVNGSAQASLIRYLGRNTAGDFDSDGKADIAVFRPSNSTWYILRSSNSQMQAAQFGIPTDKTVAADYDGDGKTDIAVYRDGNWYVLQSSNNAFRAFHWGTAADTPAPMNFYQSGRAGFTVFSPNGLWHYLSNPDSSPNLGGAASIFPFGQDGDIPVPGFYDSDGTVDFAVFRPSNGTWYVKPGNGGQMQAMQFGTNGDIPQAGDFDGDLKNDFAVYRPSNGAWYVLRSSDNQFQAAQWGATGDIPAARDYDGDGRADFAVFRPSNGTWYLLQSSKGFAAQPFGTNGDKPSN